MKTIFEKIIDREIPAVFIYEDDKAIAIMDKFPGVSGQTLVIPKKPISYVFDLDQDTYDHIFGIAKKLGPAMDQAFGAKRVCMLVEGFDVPHVHIKMYPVMEGVPLNIHHGAEAENAVLAEQAERIRVFLKI